jgi:hypothetical protein
MARNYAIEGSVNAVVGDTTLAIVSKTTARPAIYYVTHSCEASSADANDVWQLRRYTTTAPSGGTARVPEPLEVGDVAALCTAQAAPTTEPGYTGLPLLTWGLNQKLIYQFYAREGGEFVAAASATAGHGVDPSVVQTAAVYSTTFHYTE